jgi:hypothetical protein
MGTPVDPLVAAIAASVQLADGTPRIDDEVLIAHADALVALAAPRREAAAIELLALAKRLWDSDQDAWDTALAQLCLLVSVALGEARAGAALAESLGADKARAVVGAAQDLRPVGAGPRPDGSVSPLGALLANRKSKGKEGT